jgi:hypothetical protein
LSIHVDTRRAQYPLTIDPTFETAKLTASDGFPLASLGFKTAISGDTIAVGAPFSNAVYVFVKSAGGWATATQTAKLTASDGGSSLGTGVAISGDTIAAGGNGVYVYVKPAGGWVNSTETAKLTASDLPAGGYLGVNVGISGDTIVAGTTGSPGNANAVYVYVKPTTGWVNGTQTAKLTASDSASSDFFGLDVAISGDTVVAGAPEATVNGHANQGAAYAFTKPATGWANSLETAKLTASDGATGNAFGSAVAVDGDTIVAGAPNAVVNGHALQGAVYVFAKSTSDWVTGTETAKLTASDGAAGDELAIIEVGVSGDTVVAGAGLAAVGGNSQQGAAYVFSRPAGGWTNGTETAKLVASDGVAHDFFDATAISGNTIVVGANQDRNCCGAPDPPGPGAAYVFADTTPPTTSISLTPAGADGSNGWHVSSVHATVSALDSGFGVAETRCVLDPAVPPASFDDIPAGCAYTGSGADVTIDGQHTLYAASKDSAGNKETPAASSSFQIDRTAPTVTCGTTPIFTLDGPGGNVSATVTDTTSGPAASSVSAAVTSADTATAGPGTKSLTGFDNAGNQTTVHCPYTVGYRFVGFFSPLPRQNVNAGSTVSVKFALADNTGTRISDAQAQSIAAACNAQILFTALQPSPDCFSYDTVGKQFVFNLRTPRGVTGPATITAKVFSGSTVLNIASTQVNLR